MSTRDTEARRTRSTILRAIAPIPMTACLLGGCATPAAIQSFTFDSPYLRHPTEVEVLLPDLLEQGRQYPVLYMLPVNAGPRGIWGAASLQAYKHDIANRYDVICVWPTFALPPWYADHPTDEHIRQETHLLEAVIPAIEARYPAQPARAGRFLIGFSKSGWGALSLIMRHSDVFERAVAWDAPLAMTAPTGWRMREIVGTQANFERYSILHLIERHAGEFRGAPPRMILLGPGWFGEDMAIVHHRMTELGIAHVYEDTVRHFHHWRSDWFPLAVEYLLRPADSSQ